MIGLRIITAAVLVLALMLTGCRARDDVQARYTLERMLWDAQIHERKINIAFIKASQHDLDLAIEKFNAVVAYDPLTAYNTDDWDPRVVADIRRIQLVSKVALANMYFLSEQYYLAGDFYTRTLKETDLDFRGKLDVQLDLVKTLYFAGEEAALEKNCANLFREIAESPEFWRIGSDLKDVFLNVPLVLIRYYRDRELDDQYEEFSTLAEDFYTRITRTWPDDDIADKAVYARASLHMLRENWGAALADIEELLDRPTFAERRNDLLLLKGEIYAYALDDSEAGVAVFESIVEDAPGTREAFAAEYNLGSLALRGEKAREGLSALKSLESEDGVPDEIAAKSMLARAMYYESVNRWDEALVLLRRIIRLYAETQPALEAPLLITRHYVASGEPRLAARNLERATDFYVSLITRQSRYRGDRLLVEDILIENYLEMGKAREVAELIEDRSSEWDEVSSVGGLFKSALIYSMILDDKESARRVLIKSKELFPQKRYAKIAQRQLDQLVERPVNDNNDG